MHFLLCSDGTPEADQAVRFAAPLAAAAQAKVTLLGVAETPAREPALAAALERNRIALGDLAAVRAEIVLRTGPEPVREILARTLREEFDLVVIGARRKAGSGQFWRSGRVYEIVQAIAPPVLVVVGRRERLTRILVCAGGKGYINRAVRLTARLAAPAGASAVTLLHVSRRESPGHPPDEDPELARQLRAECEIFIAAGVPAEVRRRHGEVLLEIAEEFRVGDYDLVVTGTTLARGGVQQYLMGDVTREILNRAGCPVLIVRSQPPGTGPRRFLPVVRRSGLLRAWRKLFPGGGGASSD